MKYKLYISLFIIIPICIILGVKLHSYYTPAKERPIYKTVQHHDNTIRIAYIAREAAAGKTTVVVPPSVIPERRRILRHIAYDDFDAGMTRDHVCAYYGLHTIKLDPKMRIEDIRQD